jgi:hypothetical protein
LASHGTAGGLPWFDTLMAGSKLGNLGSAKAHTRSRGGPVRVEWEVMEWFGDGEEEESTGNGTPSSGKRKYAELNEPDDTTRMHRVQR